MDRRGGAVFVVVAKSFVCAFLYSLLKLVFFVTTKYKNFFSKNDDKQRAGNQKNYSRNNIRKLLPIPFFRDFFQ